MSEIDFFVFICKETSEYADFLWRCANALKSNKHIIKWKCIISGKVDKYPIHFNICDVIKSYSNASFSHGVGINRAIEIAESEYVIFAEADISILYKNWDDLIVEKLKNKFFSFGFGGKYSGKWNRVTTVPCAEFFCFKRKNIKNIKMDFTPLLNERGQSIKKKISTKEEEEITGIKRKFIMDCETGYKIAFLSYKYKWKNFLLKMVYSNSKDVKLPFPKEKRKKEKIKKILKRKKDYMAGRHYKNNLFGTHLRHGRCKKYGKSYSLIWINRIINFMEYKNNIKIDKYE